MDVGRAAGIGYRFDGSEIVFTSRAGEKPPKSLKIFITDSVGIMAVQINALAIHLPDFHQRITNWIPFGIEDASAQMSYFADGGSNGVVDNDQVVVRIERQTVGIERTFGLARGPHQL